LSALQTDQVELVLAPLQRNLKGYHLPVCSPPKPIFSDAQSFPYFSQIKTGTQFLTTYKEREQNSGSNPSFFIHLKYFQVSQK